MGDTVVFETADGEITERNADDDSVVNIHINEDKRAVIVKYEDRREMIPLERVYRVVEYNHLQ